MVYAGHSKEMKAARAVLAEQHRGDPLRDRRLKVEATAFLKRPKKHFAKDGGVKPTAPEYFEIVKKPDVDNVLKFVMDALQCVRTAQPLVMHDDCFVQKASVQKVWCLSAAEERVEIELTVC